MSESHEFLVAMEGTTFVFSSTYGRLEAFANDMAVGSEEYDIAKLYTGLAKKQFLPREVLYYLAHSLARVDGESVTIEKALPTVENMIESAGLRECSNLALLLLNIIIVGKVKKKRQALMQKRILRAEEMALISFHNTLRLFSHSVALYRSGKTLLRTVLMLLSKAKPLATKALALMSKLRKAN